MTCLKSSLLTAMKIWVFSLTVLWVFLPLSGNAKNLPGGLGSKWEESDLEESVRRDLEDEEFLSALQEFFAGREWLLLELELSETYPDVHRLHEAIKFSIGSSTAEEVRNPAYADILREKIHRYMIDDDDDDDGDVDDDDDNNLALLDSPLWMALSAARIKGTRVEKRDAPEDVRPYSSSDDFMNSPDFFGVVFTLKRKYPQVGLHNIEWAVWIVSKTSPLEELRRPDYPRRLVTKVEDRMNYPRAGNETTCPDCDSFLEAVDGVLRGPEWMRFLYNVNTKYPTEENKKIVRVSLGDVISKSTIEELQQTNYTDIIMGKIDSFVANSTSTDTGSNTQRKRDIPTIDIERERLNFHKRRMSHPKHIVGDTELQTVNNFDTALNLHV